MKKILGRTFVYSAPGPASSGTVPKLYPVPRWPQAPHSGFNSAKAAGRIDEEHAHHPSVLREGRLQ